MINFDIDCQIRNKKYDLQDKTSSLEWLQQEQNEESNDDGDSKDLQDINKQVDGVVAEAKHKLKQMEEAVSLIIEMFSKQDISRDRLSAKRPHDSPIPGGDGQEIESLRTKIDRRLSTLLT